MLVVLNDVIIPEFAVTIPVILIFWGNLALSNVPLLILEALIPCIAVPNPLKLYAVAIPLILIFWGSLELFNVPLLILEALIPCISVPNPLKLYAVAIPVVFTFPVPSSTENPFPMDGFCPTWREYSGFVVPIPTLDVVETPLLIYQPSTAIA